MVKADLTRDYYGDLEVAPTADLEEIKRQFKKLALKYHPDRNPGRENEVTSKFQSIQSAHEVLIDSQERAKYDAQRVRPAGRYQTGGNQRGNPWSHVSSQYPPPPKPPTARNRHPPPPSAGAQRYKNFETPRQSANQTAQEGAEARRSTYEAWENMRNSGPKPGPGQTWSKPGPVPKGTPQSGREESNSFKHRPPPKMAPGYEEFKANYSPGASPHRRAQSTSAQNRKGFMPNNPSGDEPAAPRGAYFTQRNKPAQAPEPPPRNPPQHFQTNPPPVDPLRQFREKADVPYEPRLSTPYATHGGEKLNPFDSPNMNRSKSTREPRDRGSDGSKHMPRAGSDSTLNSPHRNQTFTPRHAKTSYTVPTEDTSESSSDAGPKIKLRPRSHANADRPFARAKSRNFTQPSHQNKNSFPPTAQKGPLPEDAPGNKTRKPSLSEFQRWWKTNPGEPPLNPFPSDEPFAGSGQANQQPNGENPSMYGTSYNESYPQTRKVSSANFEVKFPTVSESMSFVDPYFMTSKPAQQFSKVVMSSKYPRLFPDQNSKSMLATPPSGVTGQNLYPLEEEQRSVLDKLISTKNNPIQSSTYVKMTFATTSRFTCTEQAMQNEHMHRARSSGKSSVEAGSPKSRSFTPHHSFGVNATRRFWQPTVPSEKNANFFDNSRFNFKVDDSTFQRANANGFSSSAENINTKFTPEEWEGKFEAGYFQPEQKAANMSQARARAQSASRSRGRSPIKVRPVDPHYVQQPQSESDLPAESPGGAKFSKDEWAGTFKPQTFMPPPPHPAGKVPRTARKSRGSTIKPTMGTAAVIDDSSDSSIEKPLFTGRKNFTNASTAAAPSPDAMDVDSPPTFKPATPTSRGPVPEGLSVNTSPSKRPAAPSQSTSPTDQDALKVDFEDMKIADLISSMNLPQPPIAPPEPVAPNDLHPAPDSFAAYLATFTIYMREWDLFYNRIMLHLVARKRQNDSMANKRWLDDEGLDTYRLGLREDRVVLGHLVGAEEAHGQVLKAYAILREKMKNEDEREGERPRKKVS